MRSPFRLVPDQISHETVECLRTLLAHAERGEILGIAFAAMFKGRHYIVNTAGECHRSPTFTRGMVADLHDELGSLVQRRG